MRTSRLLDIYVRDAYVDGCGELVAKIGGVWPVARDAGSDAVADGQLMRYLAETAWFPTALVPGRNIAWTPIGDRAALATIVDRGRSVRLTFTFNALDDLIEVSARIACAPSTETTWRHREPSAAPRTTGAAPSGFQRVAKRSGSCRPGRSPTGAATWSIFDSATLRILSNEAAQI